jgi:3-(3-hydroxy-phenyl)propionate hydroxylase
VNGPAPDRARGGTPGPVSNPARTRRTGDADDGTAANADADVDVLIVGAGPTGLLAACELLRRQVRVRIIDRDPRPISGNKALSLWPRALDILQDVGVGQGIVRGSTRIDAFSYFSGGRPLATFPFPPDLASRTLPQPVTERLLTQRLNQLGGKPERGVRMLVLDGIDFSGRIDRAARLTAVLEHHDGTVERLRVPYVIGADGAGSAVRGQLGIGFPGSTYDLAFALVDARVEGDLPADRVQYHQNPSGTLVIVPMPDGVFRFLSVLPEGATQRADIAGMQTIVEQRGPAGVRLTEPVWETVFRVHARQAADFQVGPVFLMGDAAHVHSPAGGQGMNNGLQDAHNLAWKLASVIHGRSPVSLLQGYGAERAEATRRIVRDTSIQTRAWMAQGPARVLARDTAFKLLERSGAVVKLYTPVMAGRRLAYPPERQTQLPGRSPVPGRRTGCGLRGGGIRVGGVFPREVALRHKISGPQADPLAWTVAVLPRFGRPARLVPRIKARTAHLPGVRVVSLGPHDVPCRRPGYWLIRPDGHIAAHGHALDLHRLEAELTRVLNPLRIR